MDWKRLAIIIIAAAIGTGILAVYWKTTAPKEAPEPVPAATPAPIDSPFVTFVDPSVGPQDAVVQIVEFGDHACPYCRSAHESLERLRAEWPEAVRVVWKAAPSALHPGSDTAAEAALCAGRQGRFWDYHGRLFGNSGLFDQASMSFIADELGLDVTAFNDCLIQRVTRPLVERTVNEALALGLTAIPTLFINGTRFEGALTYEQLLEATGL